MASISFVLLIALCSVIFSGCLASPTLRILGGDEVKPDQFPYVVSVRRNSAHICGGSIIDLNYILTAAHCVSEEGTTPVNTSAITIRVGSKNQFAGGKIVNVAEIHIHKSFGSHLYDMAVLKLESNLVLGARIQTIALADKADAVLPGSAVTISGWGRTTPDGPYAYKLHQNTATVISAAECEDDIAYGYPSTICLQNKSGAGACHGDAGGPAVYNNKLVGVSNFVIGTCGTKFPDVYARVSHFYDWIKSITNPQ